MKIIYLSQTRLDYSLNAVLLRGLRENNVSVSDIQVKKGLFGLKQALSFYRQNKNNADAVIVGYNSAALALPLRLFCRKKVIYNAVLSLYERMIVSRKLASIFSARAAYYWLSDFLAMHSANLTLVESDRQAAFIQKLFKVSASKINRSYIGVDEEIFFHDPSVTKFETFTVLFRGQFLPESGVEYAIKAAKILGGEGINFIIHGGGHNADKIKKLAEELNPRNLKLILDFLPTQELRTLMQRCHLSLGQLSDHPRLRRTIPHKAYESLAMKLPYLTASNTGVLELLTPDETCLTCDPADAKSLAEKMLWAKNNYFRAKEIAENGYKLYQDKLKPGILAKNLLGKMSTV